MTKHISARLAWHDSGWNGRICQNPKANTYCIGQYSFNRDAIVNHRDLDWEQPNAGKPCHQLDGIPPCCYSINAFGADTMQAEGHPPTWFNDGTQAKTWQLPPYTIATWPYEEMYKDDVVNPSKSGSHYNAVKRREAANAFFNELSENKSLIFYYANYSNPFSGGDINRYVIVGMSRIKAIGSEVTWINQSEKTRDSYGPNIWARNVTSDYPNQGLRIPYEQYLERPDVLDNILFVPENSRSFKYATRHISDDGALGLVERMAEIVGYLQEIGDHNETWEIRQKWLASIMAELWKSRGLYPGLVSVWDYLGFSEAIPYTMTQTEVKPEQDVKETLFGFLKGNVDDIPDLKLSRKQVKSLRRTWKLLEPDQQQLLENTLPQFDLHTQQISHILDKPNTVSLFATPTEIVENPYLLCEQYISVDPDDQITFRQIDNGVFPSPDLGSEHEFLNDDWVRLRALCVEHLQHLNQHTFLEADQILEAINHKISFMPEWKQAHFTTRYLEVDKDELQGALTYQQMEDNLYLYLKTIYEDERMVEQNLRQLAQRPDINLSSPVTEKHWYNYLFDNNSPLAQVDSAKYKEAINSQIAVCQSIFRRPLSVLCGSAGTGKTTVVKAIIKAIKKAHGSGVSFQLLAPTGKAADRLRERTGEPARTLHSFLAKNGWLNDNMTFCRDGGKQVEGVTTLIIDESSMLDLPLLAAFFKAVNWNSVQRLIFVGDPNQLPPIGTGKVFADLIDWLRQDLPEHVGELETNMRQLHNKLTDQGTGILDLASLYIRRGLAEQKTAEDEVAEEEMLQLIQEGGDITGDLRILYWQSTDELETLLTDTLVADMERETGTPFDPNRPDKLWDEALRDNDRDCLTPEAIQIISPYRGELFGIEHINQLLQKHKNGWLLENKGTLGGITFRDKVIQVINRPESRPLYGFNTNTRKREKITVFNGEIGVSKVHGFDHKKWTWSGFYLSQIQVVFSRKQDFWVEYTSENAVIENLELAYAISTHKAQGSEFKRVYFIVPKHKKGLLSRELFYTGLTRAQYHCTLLIEEDIAPLLSLRRREMSQLNRINSSLFIFQAIAPEYQTMNQWYIEGKIHRALTADMVRSKSELIIANLLADRNIPFSYEVLLQAPDGTQYLPDFTINWQGKTYYWEHFGMMHDNKYRRKHDEKLDWYKKHGFDVNLIKTYEKEGFNSQEVVQIIEEHFDVTPFGVEDVKKIIEAGKESMGVEFKMGLCLNQHPTNPKKDSNMIDNILTTVAAFLNSQDGGILLIGVDEDKDDNVNVVGINREYSCVNKNKPGQDSYELHIRDHIKKKIGGNFTLFYKIDFFEIDSNDICCIRVQPASSPAYFNGDLYVRDGNKKQKLNAQEVIDYIKNRWP